MTMGHGRRVVASIIGVVLLGSAGVSAQDNTASRAARTWRQGHERAILDEFVALLRLPNIASDRAGIQRNAEAIAEMMRRRGLSPRLLTVEGANPVVFGEIRTPGATRTIGFYAHYDGQPLDPREWTSPPFEMRGGRRFCCRPPERPSIRNGACTPVPPATTRRRSWR
jgi:hypothetical protein